MSVLREIAPCMRLKLIKCRFSLIHVPENARRWSFFHRSFEPSQIEYDDEKDMHKDVATCSQYEWKYEWGVRPCLELLLNYCRNGWPVDRKSVPDEITFFYKLINIFRITSIILWGKNDCARRFKIENVSTDTWGPQGNFEIKT